MRRRLALCTIAPLALLGGLVSACESDSAGAGASADGPNVLLIVTDDQSTSGMRWMPETRRLLTRRGLSFSNAYVTTPLCCPSRASIFSGKYVHNHGISGNPTPRQLDGYDSEATWPEVLQEAGYRTGLAGKYLNHWPEERQPEMFDFYAWADQGEASEEDKRIDSVRFDDARDFLRSSEQDDARPWALTFALHAPHTGYDPPPRYQDLHAGPYPRDAATDETDLSDKASVVRDLQSSHDQIKEAWVGHAQTLRATDDLIARLMGLLRSEDEARDTLVIFTSDNGYMMGEHGLTRKTWPYPGSIGVPMIVRWPGHVEAGERSSGLVANIDIAATVFDAAGIDPDYTADGRSLLSGKPRDWLLLEGPRLHPGAAYQAWDAYLDRGAHFIKWRDEAGYRELYDLEADPFETENLLADSDPSNDGDAAGYEAMVEEARRCEGASCP